MIRMKVWKIIFFLLLCVCKVTSYAESFTYIDWNVLKIDSVLKSYHEVIPLTDDYASYNYQVFIEYPEYVRLTIDETRFLSGQIDSLPASPVVHTNVGISRRRGYLDVSFLPIVYRDGCFQKMLSFKMRIERTPKPSVRGIMRTSASGVTRYAANSVLASGRWVKISVTSDGVYRMTPDFFKRIGFSDPSRVKLYGYGGHVQDEVIDADNDFDDLEEVALYRDEKGLLFYANGLIKWTDLEYNSQASGYEMGHRINNYARQACYFLTEGDGPAVIQQIDNSHLEPEYHTSYYYDASLYKKEEFAWYQAGRNLYENYNYANGNSRTYSLPIYNPHNNSAVLTVSFTAASSSASTVTPHVNGKTLTPVNMNGLPQYTRATTGKRSYLIENISGNTLDVTLNTTSGVDARLDYLKLTYLRKFIMSESWLPVGDEHSGVVEFTVDVQNRGRVALWRLGRRGKALVEILPVEKSGNNWSYIVDNQSQDQYVAVDLDADYPSPVYMEDVANQNLHASPQVDLVIIVPKSGKFLTQAERLAEAHERINGLRTLVVRADQVYNEFSSGTPDVTAYRRFMKMFYDRAETENDMPRYLLLFGDGRWDNRMYTSVLKSKSPDDYLLCYESENSVSETNSYVMEDYLGLLDDGEGGSLLSEKIDLGIGRFPVSTETDAKNMVDKTIDYMENKYAGSWRNVVCVLGDDGDNNLHLGMAEKVAAQVEEEHPEMQVNRIYWDTYKMVSTSTHISYPGAKTDIDRQMEEGCLMMNYTGHGNPRTFSDEYVLQLTDFEKYSSPRVPVWVSAGCDFAPFDMEEDCIGKTAVCQPIGSALAFYGTARTTYAPQNSSMNGYFTGFVLGCDEDGRRYTLGDAVRLSKVNLVTAGGSTDYTVNKFHYVLLGDPAVKLGVPEYKIVVDSINGKILDTDVLQEFKAGSLVRVAGHVETTVGERFPAFQGTVNITVYDSKSVVTCLNNYGDATEPFTFETRDRILYNGRDSVRGGCFNMEFPVPLDIKYSGESGRMVFYAVSDDLLKEANGYTEQFVVGGTSEELMTDTIGPAIEAYLNREDFTNGLTVNSSPYFVARLEDESGINTTSNGIGHDLELMIDNDPNQTYILNSYYVNDFGDYSKGMVAYSIPELSDGPHTLRFRAWDGMNNSSSVTLDFNVSKSIAPQLIDVACTQNPAKTQTTFVVHHDRPGTPANVKIEVMDYAGRIVWTHSETVTSSDGVSNVTWDLTSSSGMPLQTGVYLYRATASTADSKSASRANKIIILRNK